MVDVTAPPPPAGAPPAGDGRADAGHAAPRRRRTALGLALVAPLALVVTVVFLVPLGVLVYMSFQDWPLLGSPMPNGLDNYASIGGDDLFLGAIGFTLLYTVITTIVVFGVSFILVAISGARRRGARFYRTAFFLPYVVGTAAAALIWFASVNDQNGIANDVLIKLGLTDGPWGFLSTSAQALFTVETLVVWKFIGFQVLVLLVGLQAIPVELYEAARMDGASTLQRLRYITVPYLRPTLALLFMLSVTGSLLAFDQFIVLTKGGPDNSTVTIMFAVYNTAFRQFDLGKAAALSIVLLLALVVLNAVQFRFLRPKEDR
jgi:multiple sugar transport system permease protein